MKNLHFSNSYNVWSTENMRNEIIHQSHLRYGSLQADKVLNRSYAGMYIEWYLHNIGYWLTLPFCEYDFIRRLNIRFRDLDLEEHK